MGNQEQMEVLKRVATQMEKVFAEMFPFESKEVERKVIEDKTVIQLAITHLQTLISVENSGFPKEAPNDCFRFNGRDVTTYNQGISDCKAFMASRCDGIEKIIDKIVERYTKESLAENGSFDKEWFKSKIKKDLAHALRNWWMEVR